MLSGTYFHKLLCMEKQAMAQHCRSALCCAVIRCSALVSDSLRLYGLYPTRLLRLWDFPGKNTRVGYHAFLQGIFPTRGSNLSLLHCRQILYH